MLAVPKPSTPPHWCRLARVICVARRAQAIHIVNACLGRLIACFLADPALAAMMTNTLNQLVSTSNRLLCDARRIRDGAFPAQGANFPDVYHEQLRLSVFPSGYVVPLAEYHRLNPDAAPKPASAEEPAPATGKRPCDATPTVAPPVKRRIVASVRPDTPHPHEGVHEPPTEASGSLEVKVPATSTAGPARICLSLTSDQSRCVARPWTHSLFPRIMTAANVLHPHCHSASTASPYNPSDSDGEACVHALEPPEPIP